MDQAVGRGIKRRQAEKIEQIGADEKAYRRGNRYIPLVNGLAKPGARRSGKSRAKAARTDSGRR